MIVRCSYRTEFKSCSVNYICFFHLLLLVLCLDSILNHILLMIVRCSYRTEFKSYSVNYICFFHLLLLADRTRLESSKFTINDITETISLYNYLN